MNVRVKLAHEALVLSVAQFGGLLVGFVTMVLVSRHIGPEARGVYAWVVTLSALAAQVACLAPYQAVRAVAAHEPPPAMAGTVGILGFAGVVLTLPFLVYGWMEPVVGVHHHGFLLVAWLSVPLSAAATSLAALVHMQHKPLNTLASQLVPKGVILLAVVGLYGVGALTLEAAIWLNTLLMGLYLLLGLAQLGIPPAPFTFSLPLARDLARTLGAVWVAQLALFALPKAAILVLGTFAPLAVLGHYSISATLMETVMILPASVGMVLISHVSRVGVPSAQTQRATGLLLMGGMAVLCAVGGWLSAWLIPLLFGQAFAPAVPSFRVLLLAVMASTLYQLMQPLLLARKAMAPVLLPPVLGAMAAGGLALWWVPAGGDMGAAWATAGGFGVLALAGGVFLGRRGKAA